MTLLAVQQSSQRIEKITQGIRGDIITVAKTSERTKSEQYRSQGIAHFNDGSFEEAKERFLKAYDLDSTDSVTNFYLARISLLQNDEVNFNKYLVLAIKRANTVGEKQIYDFTAQYYKINQDREGFIESGIALLSCSPELFYSVEFKNLFQSVDMHEEILLPV